MQYAPQRSNNQSNYLVSNDDLSVMDLPRNMTQVPSMSRSSGQPSTPLLIPPLKYIVYNNPQVVYDFLISKGYLVDNKIPSTYQFAKVYVREHGEPGILEIVKVAHPDLDIIKKALGLDKNKESSFDGVAPVEKAIKEEAKEVVAPKEFKISTQTIVIILVIVVFFLLITRASK
jgi:hypothetical protein